jgi:DNA polymerase III delta prime subunit
MNNEIKQKITEILPKEKEHAFKVYKIEDISAESYNQALQDTHQVLDQIINLVRGDIREKIENMQSVAIISQGTPIQEDLISKLLVLDLLDNNKTMSEDGLYPIDCETCGESITSDNEDFNGMCKDCYETPIEE